ncbi:hypothetical protein AB0L41_34970 [Amycolatopsis mediterranei]|uniref:hypothetical protein n=1 Tax=Amycolatopsis mediterranei TaxID=33910 RepID=UPI00342B8305
MIRLIVASLLATAAVVAAGCGRPSAPAGTPSVAPSHLPSGAPSKAASMVCADEAQHEISLSLQLELARPVTPAWSDHLYSCRYTYPVGTMTLSVKELAGTAAATAYFTALRSHVTQPVTVPGLGQEAYSEPDGSLVVHKDSMVLRIDVGGLPGRFGQPPLSRSEAARRVGADIMACWTGQ